MKYKLLFFVLLFALNARSQFFQKHHVYLLVGEGLSKSVYTVSDSAGTQPGEELYGLEVPVMLECRLNRFGLGIGANFTYTDYKLINLYGSMGRRNSIRTGVDIYYHVPFGRVHFSMPVIAGASWNRFLREFNGYVYERWRATGYSVSIAVNPRWFLTKKLRLGIHAWYKFSYDWYPKGSYQWHTNPEYHFSFKGPTQSAGIGLFYRFGNIINTTRDEPIIRLVD